MEMYYETDRLVLRLLKEDFAPQVLDFYSKNKDVFEPWEPDRPEHFYSIDYQSSLLKCEFQLMLNMNTLRFWIFEKDHPNQIIGTVSFQNITRSVYQNCQIGYKFDSDYWHLGYARESIQTALQILFKEFRLHRVEALVLPENHNSIHLLEHLGFLEEGICHSCIYLHTNWADHIRYSFINNTL